MTDEEWEEARQKERVAMLISAVRKSIDEEGMAGVKIPAVPKIPVGISNGTVNGTSVTSSSVRPVTSPQKPSQKIIKLQERPSLSALSSTSLPSPPIQALEDAFFTPQSTPGIGPSTIRANSRAALRSPIAEDVNVSPTNTASTDSPAMPVTPTPANTRFFKVNTEFHTHPRVGYSEEDSPPIEFRGFKFPAPPPQQPPSPPKSTSVSSIQEDEEDNSATRRHMPLRPAPSSSTLFFDKQVEEVLNMDKAFRERVAAAKDQEADGHDADEERTDGEMMGNSCTETETESEDADEGSSFVDMGGRKRKGSGGKSDKRKSEASTIDASVFGRRVSVDTAMTSTSTATSGAASVQGSIATEAILGSPALVPSPVAHPPLPSKSARRRSSSMRLSSNSASTSASITPVLNGDGVQRFVGGSGGRARTAESNRSSSIGGKNAIPPIPNLEGLGFVGGVGRPPKMPLPPSPTVLTPPSSSGGPPASAISASSQAQITALTYALHTQRTRYENLSAHVVQLSTGWEEERRGYEGRIGELIGVVSALEVKMDALKEEFEGERFRWEREREGLRWLVEGSLGSSGTEEVLGSDAPNRRRPAMTRSTTLPLSIKPLSSQVAEQNDEDEKAEDSESNKRDAAYFGSASSPRDVGFPPEIYTTPSPSPAKPRHRNGTTSRPLSASISLRDRDSLFLQPPNTSLDASLRRRSMHDSSPGGSISIPAPDRNKRFSTGSSFLRDRPLSAALDDMIIKLQNLGDTVAVADEAEE
ncbi:hypothetical protein FRC02_011666 [Tulasnella sp. 418]|nr:hypothetical protein FRC02_011666 [Tulasnella sp. 418]